MLLSTVLDTRANKRVLLNEPLKDTNNMSTNVRQPLVKLALYIRNCIAKQETICPHVVARILNLVLTPPIDFDVPTTALDTFSNRFN